MKKLILSSILLTLGTSAFAFPILAPINACVTNDLTADSKVQLQFSYPGQGGIWSGVLKPGQKLCMHPYDWKNAPGIFDLYAVVHGPFNIPHFFQCGAGMINKRGPVDAPEFETDYKVFVPSGHTPQCQLITQGT